MNKFALAVHGGAGPDSEFIRQHQEEYKKGIEQALNVGYKVLEDGGSALDAVEAAVNAMEDNPLFNAGRGSALNEKAEVEMDASIMSGIDLKCGAVSIVKNIKNPVTLARAIMEKTSHIYLGDMGALEFSQKVGLRVMPEAYFITDHAFQQYQSAVSESTNTIDEAGQFQVKRKTHGTVGAVALDRNGNLAAATSTGGTENKVPGRIGDSSMIGVGSYANNKTCAVSTTGDGELHIQHVSAFHVSALMEYKEMRLKEAAYYLLHQKLKDVEGDMGLIAVDPEGNVALEFNSERMHRGFRTSAGEGEIKIYQNG
ncbi:MAG TPA: isoaspartyl peptidase/L-asparaginase [Flavisolibacter sp.]|jgi:beta-aspartyl-peptidase (threonine type)|nr:isoaspartyl peptidase/L-asparaginase [Flavisolibacter sp.]